MQRSLTLHVPSVDEVFSELSDLCADAHAATETGGSSSARSRHRHAKTPSDSNEPFEKWFTLLDGATRTEHERDR